MYAPSTLVGRARIIRTGETTVRGDDHGLEIDLPWTLDLPCNDVAIE